MKVPNVGGIICSRGSATRHLLFHDANWELDLFLSRETGSITVVGQVLPFNNKNMPGVYNAVAVLAEQDIFVETTTVSVHGEFCFQGVPDTELQLELFLNTTRMAVSFKP